MRHRDRNTCHCINKAAHPIYAFTTQSIYSIDGDADVMITYEAVKKNVFHVEWQ